MKSPPPWTNPEDELLKAALSKYGVHEWGRIASLLPRRSARDCKERWSQRLAPTLAHTDWSAQQDKELLRLSTLFPAQWTTIAGLLGGSRTAEACASRLRHLLDDAPSGTTSLTTGRRPIAAAPPKADRVDRPAEEEEMLAVGRARLANTVGKKARRKAREAALAASARVAMATARRDAASSGVRVSSSRTPYASLLGRDAAGHRYRGKFQETDYGKEVPMLMLPPPSSPDDDALLSPLDAAERRAQAEAERQREREVERERTADLLSGRYRSTASGDVYLQPTEASSSSAGRGSKKRPRDSAKQTHGGDEQQEAEEGEQAERTLVKKVNRLLGEVDAAAARANPTRGAAPPSLSLPSPILDADVVAKEMKAGKSTERQRGRDGAIAKLVEVGRSDVAPLLAVQRAAQAAPPVLGNVLGSEVSSEAGDDEPPRLDDEDREDGCTESGDSSMAGTDAAPQSKAERRQLVAALLDSLPPPASTTMRPPSQPLPRATTPTTSSEAASVASTLEAAAAPSSSMASALEQSSCLAATLSLPTPQRLPPTSLVSQGKAPQTTEELLSASLTALLLSLSLSPDHPLSLSLNNVTLGARAAKQLDMLGEGPTEEERRAVMDAIAQQQAEQDDRQGSAGAGRQQHLLDELQAAVQQHVEQQRADWLRSWKDGTLDADLLASLRRRQEEVGRLAEQDEAEAAASMRVEREAWQAEARRLIEANRTAVEATARVAAARYALQYESALGARMVEHEKELLRRARVVERRLQREYASRIHARG